MPVFRGTTLSTDDRIRRDVIQNLRNFGRLCFQDIEVAHGVEFSRYFARELESLDDLVDDGLIEVGQDQLRVTELGWEFVLFICEHFDAHSQRKTA
jgi:oxygen-independent coproporphyrinogen-3 oxidase